MRVAIRGGTARLVVERRDHAENGFARCRFEFAGAILPVHRRERLVGAVALHALLGILIDERSHLVFRG
jgi:hypothetical protein